MFPINLITDLIGISILVNHAFRLGTLPIYNTFVFYLLPTYLYEKKHYIHKNCVDVII